MQSSVETSDFYHIDELLLHVCATFSTADVTEAKYLHKQNQKPWYFPDNEMMMMMMMVAAWMHHQTIDQCSVDD